MLGGLSFFSIIFVFLCAHILEYLYHSRKIFWFVFLPNDNLVLCSTDLDELETKMLACYFISIVC